VEGCHRRKIMMSFIGHNVSMTYLFRAYHILPGRLRDYKMGGTLTVITSYPNYSAQTPPLTSLTSSHLSHGKKCLNLTETSGWRVLLTLSSTKT
jgi:hypothetical protein